MKSPVSNSLSHGMEVEVKYQKHFCKESHEIFRSAQKNHVWNSQPLSWSGSGKDIFPKMVFLCRSGYFMQFSAKRLF